MPLTLFKPNSKNTGSLCKFNFGPAKKGGDTKGELSLYVSIIQQATWNAGTKSGTFKENAKNPDKTISIKMSEFEVGGFINSIKRRVELKGYHTHASKAGQVQFSFTPSINQTTNLFQGFAFSVLRNGKDKFYVPIAAGEAENLTVFLDLGLKNLYTNRFKTQFGAGQPAIQTPATPEPEQAPEEFIIEPPPVAGDGSPSQAGGPEASDENPFG